MNTVQRYIPITGQKFDIFDNFMAISPT